MHVLCPDAETCFDDECRALPDAATLAYKLRQGSLHHARPASLPASEPSALSARQRKQVCRGHPAPLYRGAGRRCFSWEGCGRCCLERLSNLSGGGAIAVGLQSDKTQVHPQHLLCQLRRNTITASSTCRNCEVSCRPGGRLTRVDRAGNAN